MKSENLKELIALVVVIGISAIGVYMHQIKPVESKDIVTILQTMPIGGLYLDKEHNTVWSKVQGNALSFVRIPDPEQAQVIRDFNPGSLAGEPQANSSTTTTLPGGSKK